MTQTTLLILVLCLSFIASNCSGKENIPQLNIDVKSLKEPTLSASHGPVVNGVSLGIWSEKEVYKLNKPINIWIILSNNLKDKNGNIVPYDDSIFQESYLIVTTPEGRIKKLRQDAPGDGMVGYGFAGGISHQLHGIVRKSGCYKIQWLTEKLRSNIVEFTVER